MSPFDKLESSVVYDCGISNRINTQSISWNSSGTTLAMGGTDRMTRFYSMVDLMSSSSTSQGSSSSSSVRELATIAGAVDRVRFHPTQDNLLATTGSDMTVRLWDLRSSSSVKSAGTIDLTGGSPSGGGGSSDVSWSGSAKANASSSSSKLVVTEKNGNIHVVDTRKLGGSAKTPSASGSSGPRKASSNSNSPFLKTFALRPKIVDACVFSPSGDHLVAATSEAGYGELTVWNWEDSDERASRKYVYPAHTGPIYSFCFSPNGRHLATGGGDALVGLWDVDSMVCSSTITRCDRFVRSVSFSFDSQVVATSTEEASIDLADPVTGALLRKVSMSSATSGSSSNNNRGSRVDRNAPGADEIAFHPQAHLLACARCDSGVHSPLIIVKLMLGRQ